MGTRTIFGMNKEHKRNCPACNRVIYYTRNFSKISADQKRSKCVSCRNVGENNPMFGTVSPKGMLGKHQSLQFRQNLSKRVKGKSASDVIKKRISKNTKLAMQRPDVKKKVYDALVRTQYLKVRTDAGQLELLKRWNDLGFCFEPNYQLHTDDFLCYIDGYDKIHNVVLEYDGKYHKKAEQQRKDLVRQQQIIRILNPKRFWRYDSESKQFRSIL